ncbi:hypothetical protein BpHYR1_025457 [Brachionus plicatilis]|uniref:Uncharacterized protein n=1 Tax=Brachionus plicatilis TaxID=10195 RepID=A0A3M7Q091_BRAPC|nr:hypothetical protein BpHYR1_025457 [Brachionus plicatilis]
MIITRHVYKSQLGKNFTMKSAIRYVLIHNPLCIPQKIEQNDSVLYLHIFHSIRIMLEEVSTLMTKFVNLVYYLSKNKTNPNLILRNSLVSNRRQQKQNY